MLAAKRLSLIRKIFWSTLGVSAVFGTNAFLFAFKRSEVQNIASVVENSEALRHSLTLDAPLYSYNWKRLLPYCRDPSSAACENAVSMLIMLRNRNEDYKVVFTKTFGVADTQNNVITNLGLLNKQIDSTFTEGFGLSLGSAKALGIVDPRSYLQVVVKRGMGSPNALLQMPTGLQAASRTALNSMMQFERAKRLRTSEYTDIESQVNLLFRVLILAELLVFILVSSIDLWNNNVG